MSEQVPQPEDQSASSLDGVDARKLLAITAVGALGLGAVIYKIAHEKLRSTSFKTSEHPNEDL